MVADLPRTNERKFLVSREGLLQIKMELLKNPFPTAKAFGRKLVSSVRPIRNLFLCKGGVKLEQNIVKLFHLTIE